MRAGRQYSHCPVAETKERAEKRMWDVVAGRVSYPARRLLHFPVRWQVRRLVSGPCGAAVRDLAPRAGAQVRREEMAHTGSLWDETPTRVQVLVGDRVWAPVWNQVWDGVREAARCGGGPGR